MSVPVGFTVGTKISGRLVEIASLLKVRTVNSEPMRILLLAFCLTCWAGEAAIPSWDALPQPARQLVDDVLERNSVLEPELDVTEARKAFAALVEDCRSPTGVTDPESVIGILNAAILTKRQVNYLSRQYWRDSSFVAALLRKKGNCLATTTLYVAVGRALNLPIKAVFIPKHAFASWTDGRRRINIETTADGAMNSDVVYLGQFALDAEDFSFFGWMAPADDTRLLAELDLVAAHHLAGQLKYAEALVPLKRVCKAYPQRRDLALMALSWEADASGNRDALMAAAQTTAADTNAPRSAVLAAVRTLAGEYRARLDRKSERAALQRAWGLAPWHEQDEILEQMSTCLRGLRDHTGAALCMELAVGRDPDNIGKRAWLAGMLAEAGRMDEALTIIAAVRKENPEETYFANMQAGLLVLAGRRDEGRRLFDSIQAPRTGIQTYEINRAWFLAVWGDRATFYHQFERALAMAASPSVLSWIAEDDDLDAYRNEERFITIVETCRKRLLTNKGHSAPGP